MDSKKASFKLFLKKNSTFVVFVLLIIVTWLLYGSKFMTPAMIINLFAQNSILGLVAVGMTFVILTGGIDLSVGSILAISGVFAAFLSSSNLIVVILACIATGVFFGMLNGLIVVKLKIMPFITTLATMIGIRGLIYLITGSKTASAKDGTDAFFKLSKIDLTWLKGLLVGPKISAEAAKSTKLWIASLEKIPLFVYFLAAVIIASIILRYTKFGRSIYAVGGNANAAKMMGLNTGRIVIAAYMINGFLCAIAGLVLCSRLKAGQHVAGSNWEMEAIAATVIGGTLITGGKGKVSGTFFGVLILGIIKQIFTLQGNMNVWWQNIATGVILLLVVILQSRTGDIKKK